MSYHAPGRRSPFAPPYWRLTGPRDRTPDSHHRWTFAVQRFFAARMTTRPVGERDPRVVRAFSAVGRCTLGFEYHTFTLRVIERSRVLGIELNDETRASFLFMNLRIGKYEMLAEPLAAAAFPAYYHAAFLPPLEPGEQIFLRVKAIT